MRKKELYYHIIGWSLYILYIVIGQVFNFTKSAMPIFSYSFVLVRIVEFYVFYLWVLPRFLYKGKIPQLIGGTVITMCTFIIVRYLVEEVAFLHLFHVHNYFDGTPISFYIKDNFYYSTSGIFLSATVYLGFDSLHKEQENKSLQEEKIQAELSFLKNQINPHFLYNTLNYIYSLAYPVSEELAGAVIKLSQLMRYMLTDSADGSVDLQKEVDYIQNYISIYQLRFEDAFFVDMDVRGNIAGNRIASLILVPFVENAFKHGVVNDPAQPIEIMLNVKDKQLNFTVSNQINRDQKDHSTGIGLPNIRRRMQLLYPDKHQLTITNDGEAYTANLIVEL